MLRLPHGKSDPPGGKDPEKVPVGKKRNISIHRAKTRDEVVGAGGNLSRHFTVRRAVPEEIPARMRFENVSRHAAFAVAVIPFGQVRIDYGRLAQPSQFARLLSALQRADQHMAE
jgi:hypothetical protein